MDKKHVFLRLLWFLVNVLKVFIGTTIVVPGDLNIKNRQNDQKHSKTIVLLMVLEDQGRLLMSLAADIVD